MGNVLHLGKWVGSMWQFVRILPLTSVYFNVSEFNPGGGGNHKSSSGRWKVREGIDDTRMARCGSYQNFIIGFYFTFSISYKKKKAILQ